jgi:hypothetical protein
LKDLLHLISKKVLESMQLDWLARSWSGLARVDLSGLGRGRRGMGCAASTLVRAAAAIFASPQHH